MRNGIYNVTISHGGKKNPVEVKHFNINQKPPYWSLQLGNIRTLRTKLIESEKIT